ncbi:FUSC family protein [Saccharomonospora viridis]|uniref:FUSC family protein n=1 Tax=Saccharomonospora viridis TaxID=1852 RepID=UPI00068B3F0F|nr:FUSC family protein [Saccharomonospora viridis]
MDPSDDRAGRVIPRWLVHLLRTKPVPIHWSQLVRAAVVLSAPIAVGYLVDHIGYGALVSAGALPSITADVVGAYRSRAKRLSGALGAAVFGFALGVLTGADAVLSALVVIGIAAVSALISDAGSNASIAGLQLFVFTVLGTGQSTAGVPAGISLTCFAVGAAWGLFAALVGWTTRATVPERSAVAQVYLELATMLSAAAADDDETALDARYRLTQALNTAYDRLLSARSWLPGRDDTYRKLLNRLVASTPLVEAAVAAVNEGVRPPREVIAHLTDLSTAVLSGAPLPTLPSPPDDRPEQPPAVAALYAALRDLDAEKEQLRRARPAAWRRVWEWLLSLSSGPLTWLAAARLTVCVTLAELTRFYVPNDQSYWITLTVGLVLKPDFGSVFGRAVLRGVGTVVGAGVGGAALALTPHAALFIPLVALFGVGLAFGKGRHYGLLSAFATPLVLIQMALSSGDYEAAPERVVDTMVGCALVLVFGYLLWPGSRRPVLGRRLADVAEAISSYSEYALRPAKDAQRRNERSRRRRKAYRELSDVRTAFLQNVVEPSAAGRQAVAWWPGIVALEQLVDAITAVAVSLDRNVLEPPEESEVRKVRAALAEFSLTVRTGIEPPPVDLPQGDQLAGVRSQLAMALNVITGPDLHTFRHVR